MGLIHTLFAMLALVAVALLPGPSHALAAASSGHHDHVHAGHAANQHVHFAAAAGHVHASAHKPCKSCPCKACSIACCAPATAAVALPPLLTVTAVRNRPSLPEADRLLADALGPTPLKPPTAS